MNKKTFFILLQSLFILVLIWLVWNAYEPQQPAAEPATANSPDEPLQLDALAHRINTLEIQLENEQLARQQLENRLTELEQQGPKGFPDFTSLSVNPALSVINDEVDNTDENDLSMQQRLIQQGVPATTVNMIKSYLDSRRLQRLQLRNEAIRNGTQDSDEFIEKMYQLNDTATTLRQEFGEKVYDQYLYASGQPNRVAVRETIAGSVAESAGIQAGDIILRYANEPIYKMNDLRQATTEGSPGEGTLIELSRDHQVFSMTVPRGPLGVLMDYLRVQPQP